ncbi:T-cell receptor alpha chain V region RL-5 [Sciurus carolinensis]|nr:T-cell receptor alpha chain V region RL-5 [Sciurus carolinensis]
MPFLTINFSKSFITKVTQISSPPGRTHGDSVTQTEGKVIMSEGALLTINCTYSASSYPTLFWYVQYPGESLRLLLKAVTANDKVSNKGFEATYNKEATSFHLEKASVQESDSAVYYCALSDTVAETAGGAERKL